MYCRVSPRWSRPEWFRRVGIGEELGEQLCSAQCGSYAGYFKQWKKIAQQKYIQFKYEQKSHRLAVLCICSWTSQFFCLFAFPGGSQFQSSAPVNIPGSFSSSAPFSSPSPSPPIRPHASPFFSTHISQPGQSESTFLGPSHSSLGLWNLIQDIKWCRASVWFCQYLFFLSQVLMVWAVISGSIFHQARVPLVRPPPSCLLAPVQRLPGLNRS